MSYEPKNKSLNMYLKEQILKRLLCSKYVYLNWERKREGQIRW